MALPPGESSDDLSASIMSTPRKAKGHAVDTRKLVNAPSTPPPLSETTVYLEDM